MTASKKSTPKKETKKAAPKKAIAKKQKVNTHEGLTEAQKVSDVIQHKAI